MRDVVNTIIDVIYQYYGDALFFMLAAFSYIYLYAHEKQWRGRILYPSALVVFCIVNPILYYFVFSKMVYWRLLWMLPNTLVIALAITKLVQNCNKKLEKSVVIALFAMLIVIKGTNVYKNGIFVKAQNWQKVSKETKEVCDLILELDDSPRCVMPASLFSEVRQYSGNIKMMYGRDVDNYIVETDSYQQSINKELELEYPNYSYVLDIMKYKGYDYLITYKNKPVDELVLNEYGFAETGQTEQYILYLCNNVNIETELGWLVTQYDSPAPNNAMCYTIEDKKGNLVIIDGGYGWRTWTINKILEKYNNHITAWIMTLPFDGDLGALKSIIQEFDVVIDNFYVFSADDYNSYYQTCSLMEFVKNYPYVNYVKAGDKVDIVGLDVRFLSTCNSNGDIEKSNHNNVGSLSFLVTGREESMLFCSDMRATIDSSLVTKYGKSLDVDYVQLAFTNWDNISLDFIEYVSPKVIYLDALEDMSFRFEADEWSAYLEEEKVKIFEQNTAINGILLK